MSLRELKQKKQSGWLLWFASRTCRHLALGLGIQNGGKPSQEPRALRHHSPVSWAGSRRADLELFFPCLHFLTATIRAGRGAPAAEAPISGSACNIHGALRNSYRSITPVSRTPCTPGAALRHLLGPGPWGGRAAVLGAAGGHGHRAASDGTEGTGTLPQPVLLAPTLILSRQCPARC